MKHTVITSKEEQPYFLAWNEFKDKAEIEIKTDNILWKFGTREEAFTASNRFANLGFEYVRVLQKGGMNNAE